MPIEFQTSLELDLVYARWWGFMTEEARRKNFEAYLQDVHYRPGRRELIDLSGITGTDFDFDRAQLLLHQLRMNGSRKDMLTFRVILAPGEVPYGCARMFQAMAEATQNGHVKVFKTERNALAALELSAPTIEALLEEGQFLPHVKRTSALT